MDAKDLIKSVAPLLGTALAGPLGGVAASFIADKLGVPDKTVKAVTQALGEATLTPEQVASIRAAEIDFQKFCKEHELDPERLAVEDRKSAREANVAGNTQRSLFWLSLLLLSVTFGAEIRVLFYGYPKEIVDAVLVGRILGLLDGVALQVMNYWYGTTSGSLVKSSLLANSTPAR